MELIPLQQVGNMSHNTMWYLYKLQLESVLSKIKTAHIKQDNPVSKLEPLELPNPVSKRGKLQPLSPSTANTLEDDDKVDRLLKKSHNNGSGMKPK